MPRIVYGVSSIGWGHATRAVAVGERLRAAGADIVFVSGGTAVECLRGSGFAVEDAVTEPMPKVEGGEMKNAASWYFRSWLAFRESKRRLGEILDRTEPDAVVGDEEFTSVSLALERGIPHALIADELELGFARTWLARRFENRVLDWYKDLQRSVSLLIIPEEGQSGGNRRYVGPMVRGLTRSRDQVMDGLGLRRESRIIAVALSGTGIGSYLVSGAMEALSALPDAVLVLVGNRGERVRGERVIDLGVVNDGQNVVAAADIVVSTAGKSTIDEADRFGTPIVAIPIRNHGEQVRNAASLGYSPDDIAMLPELIVSKMGRRLEPRSSNGAETAAELIGSLGRR